MNVYELEKQATPEPWPLMENAADSDMAAFVITDGMVRLMADPRHPSEARANAKLLAHCRNNFMRALEALKVMTQIVLQEYPLHDKRNRKARAVLDTITELEEVK